MFVIIIFPNAELEFSLDEISSEITTENRHGEVDTASSIGREAW